MPAALTVREPAQLQALAHPVRVSVLEALRTPGSAAGVARVLGHSRQAINYHVRALHSAGMLRKAGTRRNGNFVEQLYRAVAERFIIAPDLTISPERVSRAFTDQVSLRYLSEFAERLNGDSLALIDRAADRPTTVPSAVVEAEVHFAGEEERSAFLREYMEMFRELLDRHGTRTGEPFRAAFVIYPNVEEQT